MRPESPHPLVHLELHTDDLARATSFYERLLGWRGESVESGAGPYVTLDMGSDVTGGAVGCGTPKALWLPYVQVPDLVEATERARSLGAAVQVEPREGPVGWRSMIATPAGAAIALWQPKR
ncbi:MAG TPA: VOC family protein [Thermoleophilaceae bacterium]